MVPFRIVSGTKVLFRSFILTLCFCLLLPGVVLPLRAADITVTEDSANATLLPDEGNVYTVGTGGDFTFSGIFSGFGPFEKAGPGTLTLSGQNTYTGSTIVSGGTLKFLNFGLSNPDTFGHRVTGTGSLLDLGSLGLTLGDTGSGWMTVDNGGSVTTTGVLNLGNSVGSFGHLILDGGNFTSNSGVGTTSTIGESGIGVLDVTNGAEAVFHRDVVLGSESGSRGTVTVDGATSLLQSGDQLIVGDFGTGVLNLTGGGNATSQSSIGLGRNAGSSGKITVGSGSTLTSTTGNVYVGGDGTADGGKGLLAGTGTVNANTGTVQVHGTGTLSAGDYAGQIGTLTIDGNLQMDSGSVVRVDLGTGAGNNDKIDVVNNGVISFNANPTVNIDFTSLHKTEAGVTIVASTQAMTGTPTYNYTVNGESLLGTRGAGAVVNTSDVNNIKVNITRVVNQVSTTSNNSANTLWVNDPTDPGALPWTGNVNNFFDGDAAVFSNMRGMGVTDFVKTVFIGNAEGTGRRTVAEMIVVENSSVNGDLTIIGNILADGTKTTLVADNSGKLILRSIGRVALNGENEFMSGIRVDAPGVGGNSKLGILSDKALGTYKTDTVTPADSRGQVTIDNPTTIDIGAAYTTTRTINNRFVVNDDTWISLTASMPNVQTLIVDGVKNEEAGGKGGAFYLGTGNVDFNVSGYFGISNSSADTGGAVYIETGQSFSHNTLRGARYTDNKATIDGGAFYVNGDHTVRWNTLFEGNTAVRDGGAIYATAGVASALTLQTAFGSPSIVFSGNKNAAGANSIHLGGNMDLKITGDGSVFFDDPISASGNGNSFTMTDFPDRSLMVQLAGDNVISQNGDGGGAISIVHGMLRLADGATLTSEGDASTFSLDAGTTLAGTGIVATKVGATLSGTLSPDSDRFETPIGIGTNNVTTARSTVDPSKMIGTLTFRATDTVFTTNFDSDTNLRIDLDENNVSDKIVLDKIELDFAVAETSKLTLGDWVEGTFTIIEAVNGGVLATDAGAKFNISVGVAALTSRQQATLALKNTDTVLELTTLTKNLDLVWDGIVSNDWNNNKTNTNWNIGTEYFALNDYVTFDDTANDFSVAVDTLGVAVSGMKVESGDYTFTGGTITGRNDYADKTQTRTGKLEITGGSAAFENGIDFAQGAEVGALGMLKFGGTARSIAQDVANSGSLEYIHTTGTMTQTGNITGAGTVAMNGAGTLVLDAASMNGAFTQSAGTVRLGNNRTWTGSYTQSGGTFDAASGSSVTIAGAVSMGGTLSGTGTINTATLNVTGGTISPATAGTIGTLNVVGDVSLDATILAVDVAASNSSDKIAVTGGLTFAGNNNTIRLSQWLDGTYTILSASTGIADIAGQFDALSFTAAPIKTDRYTETIQRANGDKDLRVVLKSDNNLALTWTGATGGNWNTTETDWTSNEGIVPVTTFANGDKTIFGAGGANRSINVAAGGVTVSEMVISGNSYTFSGGKIKGSTTIKGDILTNPLGKLLVTGGSATFRNEIEFLTAEVSAGATLALGGTATRANATAVAVAATGNFNFTNTAGTVTQTGNITGSGRVAMSGAGTLVLDAASMNGTFTQSAGTVRLGNNRTWTGSYTQSGGTFDVASGNTATLTGGTSFDGTLHVDGILNVLSTLTLPGTLTGAGTVNVGASGNGTFDATGGTISPGNSIGTLIVGGNLKMDGTTLEIELGATDASDKIVVTNNVLFGGSAANTIDVASWLNGTYTVLESTGGTIAAIAGNFNPVTVGGATPGRRQSATLDLVGNKLVVTFLSDNNVALNWTGATNQTWDQSTDNWTDGAATPVTAFAHGDLLNFDTTGQEGDIDVASNVTVSGMIVDGGTYVFSGGKITGNTTSATGNLITPTGKLAVTGGSATFGNELDFLNGYDLSGGRTTFNAVIASSAGSVTMTGTAAATFGVASDRTQDVAISGTDSNSLTYAVTAGTLTQTGNITGIGNVVKTGAGKLVLNAGVQQGSFDQQAGGVDLLSNWTGGYTQQSGSGTLTFGNNIDISGQVSFGADVVLDGTHELGSLHLDGATLNYSIDATNRSDRLDVIGNVTYGANSTVKTNTWIGGTYALLSAGGNVDSSKFTLDTTGIGSRQSAVLNVSGNDLLLNIATTLNRDILWIGNADNRWDTTTVGNWVDATTGVAEKFNDEDYVIFDAQGGGGVTPRTVDLSADAVVAGMRINGGNYTFAGGDIIGIMATDRSQTVTGRLDVNAGSAVFDNVAEFENGVSIAAGASATFNAGSATSGNMLYNNYGTLVLGRGDDCIQTGDISGTGNVTKSGAGIVTLRGEKSGTGRFTQQSGVVVLENSWAGNYVQNVGTVLTPVNNARIGGNTNLGGTVNLDGVLNVGGNLHLDGATLNIDLYNGNLSDRIAVAGNVTFGNLVNTIAVGSWADGTFTIIDAANIESIESKFALQHGGQTLDPATARLMVRNDRQLVLSTDPFVGTDRLVWTGAAGTARWNGGDLNWVLENEPTSLTFKNGDYVLFTGLGTGTVTVEQDVIVSGMEITAGRYVFKPVLRDDAATTIGGVYDSTYAGAGKLTVSGADTIVTMKVATDFQRGIVLSGGTFVIGHDDALGRYRQNTADDTLSAGQATVTTGSTATVFAETSHTIDNRFVVRDGGNLTIGVAENEQLIVEGVHTTGAVHGGALAIHDASVRLDGNLIFRNNSTEGRGGAVYMENSTLLFDSSKGGIGFKGNTDSTGDNAVMLAGSGNRLRFTGADWGVVFDDPITASGTSGDNRIEVDFMNPNVFAQLSADSVLNNVSPTSAVRLAVDSGMFRVAEGSTFDVGSNGAVSVAKAGSLGGGGTVTASSFDISGSVDPDTAVFTTTSSVLGARNLYGLLTLRGDAHFSGATLRTDLATFSGLPYSDKLFIDGNLTRNGTNVVDINAWSDGTFTFLEKTGGNDFQIGEELGIRIGGESIVGTALEDKVKVVLDGKTQKLEIEKIASKRITWTGSTPDNNFISLAAQGNWVDDYGNAAMYLPTAYGVFDASAAVQGEIILGSLDGNGNVLYGGRTFAGLEIFGGRYTFVGGDLFGRKNEEKNMHGNLLIAGGEVGFKNNVYFQSDIQILNAADVTLSGRHAFHTEALFFVGEKASLTLEIGDDLIRGAEVRIDGTLTLTDEPLPTSTKPHYFNRVILATDLPLDRNSLAAQINRTEILVRRSAVFGGDETTGSWMDVQYKTVPLGEYADTQSFTDNEAAIADYLQETFNKDEMEPLEWMLLTGFKNEDDLNAFFGLLANTALLADAKNAALSSPFRAAFRNLRDWNEYRNTEDGRCGGFFDRRRSSTRNFWFETYHHELEQSGDGNAGGFGISRTGMNLGVDKRFSPNFVLGAMFGYAQPKLHRSGSRIETDDYTFGLFGKYRLNSNWDVNAYAGYGKQKYDSKQRVTYDGHAGARFDGEAFFSSVEFIRSVRLYRNFTLLPLLALDYQKAETDSFSEEGSAIRQRYYKSDISQTVLRFGVNSKWQMTDRARLDTRLQYGRLIGGNDTSSIRTVMDGSSAAPMLIRGVDTGRDRLNIGVGGRYAFGASKQYHLFGHYDFDRGNRSKSHTGELGFLYNW